MIDLCQHKLAKLVTGRGGTVKQVLQQATVRGRSISTLHSNGIAFMHTQLCRTTAVCTEAEALVSQHFSLGFPLQSAFLYWINTVLAAVPNTNDQTTAIV